MERAVAEAAADNVRGSSVAEALEKGFVEQHTARSSRRIVCVGREQQLPAVVAAATSLLQQHVAAEEGEEECVER